MAGTCVPGLDVFCIGSVLPGRSSRAGMFTGRTIGIVARILVHVERASLRRLPGVIDTIASAVRRSDGGGSFPGHHLGATSAGRRAGRPTARAGSRRLLASRLWGFYPAMFGAQSMPAARCSSHSGDISPRVPAAPSRPRSGPLSATTLVQSVLPAADRAPHAGLECASVFAAARCRSSEPRAPLPVSGACETGQSGQRPGRRHVPAT